MSAFLLVLLTRLCSRADAIPHDHGPKAPEPEKFLVWGPGLRADFHMPVRYFFIQAVSRDGLNITERLPVNFEVKLVETTLNQPISSKSSVSYLYDGKYVFQMRLHRSLEHKHLNVTLIYLRKVVTGYPIQLKRPIYSDACHCPTVNLTDWMKRTGCPASYGQIDEDFKAFPTINMRTVLSTFEKKIFNTGSVGACRYIIRKNKIYRKCYGKHVGFNMFSDTVLISLTRKMVLPDMEFLWNLGDWPLSRKAENYRLPILSWCGSEDTYDIVLPTYIMMENVLEMMGRASMDIFYVISRSQHVPWHERTNLGFFRGRDSSEERLKLVRMSLARPDMLDARLTNMFFFRNDSTVGERAEHIPFSLFFSHKYQINMDGTVAAYRLPFLLAGGSVVLKQASKYYEHFYSLLQSGKHYVPLQRSIEDVMKQLIWLRTNDDMAKKIAEQAREFVLEHLTPEHIFCYHGRVFERYAKAQQMAKSDEIPGPEFERVTVAKYMYKRSETCDCSSNAQHDEL